MVIGSNDARHTLVATQNVTSCDGGKEGKQVSERFQPRVILGEKFANDLFSELFI
jgi:hypothetical protein